MPRKKTKGKELKTLSTPKQEPNAYDKLCEEIVAIQGESAPSKLRKLVDFEKDKVIADLGYTEQEIEQHLKATYLEVLRDLKMPAAYCIKKLAELETRNEKDRLRRTSDEITDMDLKIVHAMTDLVKTLDKVGFKKKSEVEVHHIFHDEKDTVIDADWSHVHKSEEEEEDQ